MFVRYSVCLVAFIYLYLYVYNEFNKIMAAKFVKIEHFQYTSKLLAFVNDYEYIRLREVYSHTELPPW